MGQAESPDAKDQESYCYHPRLVIVPRLVKDEGMLSDETSRQMSWYL